MSYNSPGAIHSYYVVGEETSLEFRDGELWTPDGPAWQGSAESSIPEQDREWIQAIREDRLPAVHPGSIIPAMRALAAAEASARTSS